MVLKGLKLIDINNNGYYMTLTFEDGYVLEISPDNYGENVKGQISKIVYEKVEKI